MKKLMIAFAATAALVSVASATDWFTGTIGSEAGGSWTMTPGDDGEITTNNTTLVLEDAAASFAATSPKSLSGSENLNFATSAKFRFSYDELPEIDSDAKAGVVVYNNLYYVLEKDGTTNTWVSTEIDATLDSAVDVSVTISNGNNAVYAIYNIGGTPITKEVVAGDSAWGTVDYKGSGEVASLVGTTISLGGSDYPIPGPGNKTIAKSIADPWAAAQGIPEGKIAEVLASDTEFNGRTAAESCLLGVATNAALKATVVDEDAAKLGFDLDCTPVSGRALIKVKKDDAVVESGVAVDVDKVSLAIDDGIYQVVAEVDGANKQIPVSQLIGVKGTEVAAKTVYFIGAPYAECAIADLFKKTCCAAGDKVEVYDSESDSFKTWQLNGSGAWEFADGQGTEPELIKKGQAVKYTTAAATAEQAKLYQVGDVSAATSTPVVKGKWNLVASPKGSIAATELPLDSAAAQAIQLGASGTAVAKTYLKSGDNVMYRNGYKGPWYTASDEVKVTNAFFVKPTNAESINW